MTDAGSLSVQSLRGFLGLAALEGFDTATLLADAGISPEDLSDVDGRVELGRSEALAAAVMRRLPERRILRAFSRLKAGDFGMLDYVIRNSRTLGESLERLARYTHVNNSIADCTLEFDAEVARVSLVQPRSLAPAFVHLSATSWLASCVVIARQLVGDEWSPREAYLPNPEPGPEDRQAYEELLRCPVSFAATAAGFVLPRAELAMSVKGADPVLVELMEPVLDRKLLATSPGARLAAPVRQALFTMLGGQEPTLERVAKRLGTTPSSRS